CARNDGYGMDYW
nr:immunoglobulin heavy chain junction region [Mus musculus]NSM07898.1 immunoglobulin heavy chain junction region [Mus musculus]